MKVERLGNVFPVIRNGANIKQDKVTDGYPITRIETIADGTIDLSRVGYASIHDETFSDFYLKENDILMSHINSVSHLGKVALVSRINEKVIHGMNLLCLKADESKIHPTYSYYFLKSPIFRSKIKRITKKSVNQASFNISNLKDIEFPLPPLPDQIHIANLLSKAENLIAQRKESIRLLDEFLKSTFLEMFGDPVRNEKGFDPITLGDLFKVSSGDGLTSDNMNPSGNHNVYGGNGVNGKHDKYMFDEPQIVIGRVGFYCGAVHLTEPKSWVTDNALYIKELYKASNIQYLKHFLTLLNLNRFAGQAAQPLISGNRLYPIKTFYAPIDLQNQFAEIVEKTEALKTQYQQSLQELENLYGSLSQKAFRGELSVKQLAKA